MAGRRTVKLSLSFLISRDHLDLATIIFDEFNLPEHWKYVILVLMKCARNHVFDCFKRHCNIIMKNKTLNCFKPKLLYAARYPPMVVRVVPTTKQFII